MDTKREHRTHAEGSPRGNPYDLTYSPSGRLIGKFRDNNSVTLSATVDMAYSWYACEHQIIKHMTVSYCDDYQPHAVRHIFDEENMTHCDLRWDPAGNLGQISVSLKDNVFDHGRFLFWTVDNRMHAAVDDKHYSYYTYDYTGERRLKLTGESNRLDVNADFMTTGTLLNTPTLYPSAYLVLTSKGYTKHYYAGADRVAASLGGGGLKAVGSNPEMQERANGLFWESHERVNGRMLQENDHECIWQSSLFTQEYYGFIKDIPGRMNASVEFYLNDLYYNLKMLAEEQHDEKDVYFYHSDHLGSASWITDGGGMAVQHIQYLPYGEPYVNQRISGYNERFTFTGKERDEETGFGYFGARYMDHELMTMWLSVDPLADKYPSISPYAYCAWNPIKLVDPNGMDTIVFDGNGNFSKRIKADGNHVGRLLDNSNGDKGFDFEFVCQQDADRCCSPGSPEELDIQCRDKLPHGKDCPAEERSPIHRIELVWQKNIISMLKESGACDKSFLPRIGYAISESDGGRLDFDNTYRNKKGGWKDNTLYIPMVPGKKYAHNASNLGNFLWGAAMYKMGISYTDVVLGSNLHALIKHREFDSRDDQLSIGLGYNYSFKAARSR